MNKSFQKIITNKTSSAGNQAFTIIPLHVKPSINLGFRLLLAWAMI